MRLGFDLIFIVTFERLLCRLHRFFDLGLFSGLDLIAILGQRLADLMDHRFALIASVSQLDPLLVIGRIGLGILDHLLDLGLRQTRIGLDRDLVFFAGRLVFGRHMQNTVGINVKGHLNLRCATGRRRNTFQIELAQTLVTDRDLTLALKYLDRHCRLIVVGG